MSGDHDLAGAAQHLKRALALDAGWHAVSLFAGLKCRTVLRAGVPCIGVARAQMGIRVLTSMPPT